MAITESLGYGGTITEDDLPRWAKSFPGEYGVRSAGAWRVSVKTGVDRTVGIAAGTGYGHAVIDTNDAEVTLSFDTQTSGTRYDLVVARRNWATDTTAFAVVKGTSSVLATFSSRNTNPGVLDDQPIALVPIVGNGTGGEIGTIRDARVWQANGGAYARDEIVLQYVDDTGTHVTIGTTLHTRTVDASSNPAWHKMPTGLLSASTGKSGAPVAPILEQVGYQFVGTLTAGVLPTVTFPVPFPNGVIGVWLTTLSGAAADPVINTNLLSTTSFTAILPSVASGTQVRYCWLAKGW